MNLTFGSDILVVFLPAPACLPALWSQVLELWGEGASVEEAAEAVKSCPEEIKRPYYGKEVTWSIVVSACVCVCVCIF